MWDICDSVVYKDVVLTNSKNALEWGELAFIDNSEMLQEYESKDAG